MAIQGPTLSNTAAKIRLVASSIHDPFHNSERSASNFLDVAYRATNRTADSGRPSTLRIPRKLMMVIPKA